jgi:hypothetical protein
MPLGRIVISIFLLVTLVAPIRVGFYGLAITSMYLVWVPPSGSG